MEALKKYVKRIYYVIAGTVFFWVMSYFVIWQMTAEGDRMAAYIANLVMIAGMLIDDKIRLLYIRRGWKNPFRKWKWPAAWFDDFMDIDNPVSIKTSLYLFYIFALIVSHVLMLNPDLNVSESTRDYFTVIGYGLILLVAVDKFTGTLKKDNREIEACESGTPADEAEIDPEEEGL